MEFEIIPRCGVDCVELLVAASEVNMGNGTRGCGGKWISGDELENLRDDLTGGENQAEAHWVVEVESSPLWLVLITV